MICLATCPFWEFNLSTQADQCKNISCAQNRINLATHNYSCVTNLADLSLYNETNTTIWYNFTSTTFNPVSQCNYTGCIHGYICKPSCSAPFCDGLLNATYSSGGMVCISPCTYPNFNLSTNKTICMNVNCTPLIIAVFSSNNDTCLNSSQNLTSYYSTNQSLWTQGPPDVYT